jgi:hypothetical protein
MPIAPGLAPQVPLPAPNIVPLGQKVLPVEPARRVTPSKEARRTDLDQDKKRRRHDDRGGTLDLEV